MVAQSLETSRCTTWRLTRLRAARYFHRLFSSFLDMAKSAKADKPPSFEDALAELEQIVARMEGGQLPLEQSLADYRRGAELLKFCHAALGAAEQEIKILEGSVLSTFSPEQTPVDE
jgi:exodeoxyribonuclease VII small subunit